MLDIGAHGAELLLASTPVDRSVAVTYVIRKSTGAYEPPAASALSIEAWPQPVAAGGVLQLHVEAMADNALQLSLCDMLGRERISLKAQSAETFSIDLTPLQLTPGIYLLRVHSTGGKTAIKMISVVR